MVVGLVTDLLVIWLVWMLFTVSSRPETLLLKSSRLVFVVTGVGELVGTEFGKAVALTIGLIVVGAG